MEKQNPLFSVSDFIALVNQTLDFAYSVVEIEGEVANFKVNQGKYVFFDLKDASGTVNCFMSLFQLRQPIEDGMKLIITASPKVTNWGRFSVTVRQVRLVGEGNLKKSFELLKAKLDKEGLFAAERKRRLPTIPHRIAVISSTTSAGYADFIKIVNDRFGGLIIDVAHVQVQGAVAADQIIRALGYFNEQTDLYDVIVVIRGGGSADDLAVFNDEPLVRAVARSRTPVLSGVGHEIDEHLVDLAADVAAATPSNAAQIVVPDRHSLIVSVWQDVRFMLRSVEQRIATDQLSTRDSLTHILGKIERRLDERLSEVGLLTRLVHQFDPSQALQRGYSIVRGEFAVGKEIEIEQYKRRIKAEVRHVEST